jgi:predicted RNA binding protein YcfA (HicA-like mRNA interferase family)
VSNWPSSKARVVYAALLKIGWRPKPHGGTSHRQLQRDGYPNYTFAFHDNEEIGSVMLVRIAKKTGLKSSDL